MKLHKNRDKQIEYKSDIQKEIVEYNQLLEEYQISFSDLTNYCPKCNTKRQDVIKVAKLISENNKLRTYIIEKKQLPVKELQKLVSDFHQTIEKYRKYMIAVILIYIGDFTFMKNYINV